MDDLDKLVQQTDQFAHTIAAISSEVSQKPLSVSVTRDGKLRSNTAI